MRLSRLGEFGAIERIKGICAKPGREVVVGIGDDAAAFRPTPGKLTLVSTDMMVEGVHFDLVYTPFEALGNKALSVNISDIAAMGGRTRYYLVSVSLHPELETKDLDGLYGGMEKAAAPFGVRAIGGDTCSTHGPMAISVTVLGEPAGKRPVTRSGARPGDDIYVSGPLGGSAGGLELLSSPLKLRGDKRGVIKGAVEGLIRRHLYPVPRVELGTELARAGLATSMIDISDGFSSDLAHILEGSGTGAEIHIDRLPVAGGLDVVFGREKALGLALHGGEDYELLFTAGRRAGKAVERLGGLKVGSVTDGPGAYLVAEGGRRARLSPRGYEHFRI